MKGKGRRRKRVYEVAGVVYICCRLKLRKVNEANFEIK
jgi:hypothetical protein